jgi:hypothetical protein
MKSTEAARGRDIGMKSTDAARGRDIGTKSTDAARGRDIVIVFCCQVTITEISYRIAKHVVAYKVDLLFHTDF